MLDNWRKEQEYLSLDELIWKLYTDTGFYNYVGLMPNGDLRQANLKMLFQKAKQYEEANFKGLYNFINFIDKLKLSSGDMNSAKIIGENDDVVRIMSIHKSKGLEFPVVFLSSMGKQFNLTDLNKNVLLHQEMGIGVKYIDYDKQIQYDTLNKSAIKNKILLETLSEEMRVLYVALTRAKEKLYVTGISKDYEKELEKIKSNVEKYPKENKKINSILLKKYKRYLDWILLVYNYESKEDIEKSKTELKVHKKQELLCSFTKIDSKKINVIEELEKVKIDKEDVNKIEELLNYEYPHKIDIIIPTKTAVTTLKDLKNNNIVEENITLSKPELKEAKEIQKEKPFYINIPANTIYEEKTNENILVQGIIDLYYIDKNDNLNLVDYKTDYVEKGNENSLITKYKKQLELYKKALEKSLEKQVKNTYIYSVYLNKEIRL